MISQNPRRQTASFIDPWPWLALLSGGIVLIGLVATPFFSQTLLSTDVTVEPEDIAAATSPFTLRPRLAGALRIDVRARVPVGRWLTYEIQLQDPQGNVLAAALKSAWHENGTWYEDGESGTWQESDLRGGLDVLAQQPEEVTIAIAVLDYADTAGQFIEEPANFAVEVRSGVIDTHYLWPGLVGVLGLSLLAFWATRTSGQGVMVKTIPDSEVGDRAILGGPHNLVRLQVTTQADETAPPRFQIQLRLRDGNGTLVYTEKHSALAQIKKDSEGNPEKATAHLKLFFELEAIDSYGVSVVVIPDASVDKTTLTVAQKARTCAGVEVIQIAAPR